jgi:hypothetical protein
MKSLDDIHDRLLELAGVEPVEEAQVMALQGRAMECDLEVAAWLHAGAKEHERRDIVRRVLELHRDVLMLARTRRGLAAEPIRARSA